MNRSDLREIVRESLPAILAQGEAFASEFHRRLFEARPELLPLFPSDPSQRRQHLESLLGLAKVSVEYGPSRWQASVSTSKDPLLRLALWCRAGGPLQAVGPDALKDVGEVFVDAVSATLDDCSANQRSALAQSYARFAGAHRVLTQSTVHASGIRDKRKRNPLVLSAQLDEELCLASLLEALSLCEQCLLLSFKDEQDKSSGSLLIKSGQILEAKCQEEGGQPAFRLLLARPHHRVRITRVTKRSKQHALVGELLELLADNQGDLPSTQLVDPSRVAANREPLAAAESHPDAQDKSPEAVASSEPRAGVPTPLISAVPIEPLSTDAPMDTQPIALEPWAMGSAHAAPFVPQDLSLSRVQGAWTRALQKIPHLRAVILLAAPNTPRGTFWSRDGAQISISDLSRFGQAVVWAQMQLPKLFGPQEQGGWSNTSEHALGCVVTALDTSGRVRICLFDAATPLAKVRHTTGTVVKLSRAEQAAFGT